MRGMLIKGLTVDMTEIFARNDILSLLTFSKIKMVFVILVFILKKIKIRNSSKKNLQ